MKKLILITLLLITPLTVFSQHRKFAYSDRKCDKFVNCHDARDGKRDRNRRYIYSSDERMRCRFRRVRTKYGYKLVRCTKYDY